MTDQKITDLGALAGADVAQEDLLVVVDVSDTSMAATGTDKKLVRGDAFNLLQPSTVSGSTGTLQTVKGGDTDALYAGYLDLLGGDSSYGSGKGGKVHVTGGGGYYGGAVYVTGGTGTGYPGNVTISGGPPIGTAIVKGADGRSGVEQGGEVIVRGGGGGTAGGSGGPANLQGGSANGGDYNGGNVSLVPGNKHGTGTPGSIYLYAQAGHVVIEIGDQTIGFFDTEPIAQHAAIGDASGGAVVDAEARAALNTLLAAMRTYGLIAT